jgi:hypothetical protein
MAAPEGLSTLQGTSTSKLFHSAKELVLPAVMTSKNGASATQPLEGEDLFEWICSEEWRTSDGLEAGAQRRAMAWLVVGGLAAIAALAVFVLVLAV